MLKYLIPIALLPILPFLPWWGSAPAPVVAQPGVEFAYWNDGDAHATGGWVSAQEAANMNLPEPPNDGVQMCDIVDPDTGEILETGRDRCLALREDPNKRCIVAVGPEPGCVWCHMCNYLNGMGEPNDASDCNCFERGYRYIDTERDESHGVNE